MQRSMWEALQQGNAQPIGGDYTKEAGLNIPAFFHGQGLKFLPVLGINEYDLRKAEKGNLPIVLCEDSYLRAASVFWDKSLDLLLRSSVSLTCDCKGYYIDATRPSNLEDMVQTAEVPEKDIEAAKRLIGKITSLKLTKYNNQPQTVKLPGAPGREKVLVIDQDFGDMSLKLGLAPESLFPEMVAAAADENPGADVIVKTHPDALVAGGRKGCLSDIVESDRIHKLCVPANPYSVLEQVSKVYVATSAFGFESLLAGKPVRIFGMPWYAGWGVTQDEQKNARRTRKRTVEELFSIFYCSYSRYANPMTRKPCNIEEAIDILTDLRNRLTQ